jgi:hypothetical protein
MSVSVLSSSFPEAMRGLIWLDEKRKPAPHVQPDLTWRRKWHTPQSEYKQHSMSVFIPTALLTALALRCGDIELQTRAFYALASVNRIYHLISLILHYVYLVLLRETFQGEQFYFVCYLTMLYQYFKMCRLLVSCRWKWKNAEMSYCWVVLFIFKTGNYTSRMTVYLKYYLKNTIFLKHVIQHDTKIKFRT